MNRTLSCLVGLAFSVVARAAEVPAKLPASAHHAAVGLTITALRTQPNYGTEAAPDGRRFLVLTATWEDRVDPKIAEERQLPLGFKNDNLSEALALVVDGKETIPVESRATDTANLDTNDTDIVASTGSSTDAGYIRQFVGLKNDAGKRSQVYFNLAKPGDKTTGELVFSIPAQPWTSLELRYQDPFGGTFKLPLAGTPPSNVSERDPADAQSNQVLMVSARLAATPATTEAPPPGRRYVTVDFQAKSLMKVLDNLPVYDGSHEAGAQGLRPDPARWIELRTNLQLVADNSLPCGLEKESDAPEVGGFLPDTWTHHRLVYLVPADAKSLDLRCFFPVYTIPGIDGDVHPKPMTFHLSGPAAPASAPLPAGEKKLKDGTVELSFSHVTASQFAGESAADGEVFLILTCAARNSGPEIEEFRAAEQLVLFNGDAQSSPDEISARGPRAAPSTFYLSTGESRSVQVVWRVPRKLTKAEFGLKGNFVAEKFTLPLPGK
jgi:hypothetical protein